MGKLSELSEKSDLQLRKKGTFIVEFNGETVTSSLSMDFLVG